jgi:HAD superfamily hydrolase (TIGR01509 family)
VSRVARFSLIVFDMDGVLTDSSGGHARAYDDLWADIGLAHPPPYSQISGRPTEPVVRELTAELHPSEEDIRRWVEFKQVRAREYLGQLAIFADALPVVSALAGEGFRLALGTSASRVTSRMLLQQAGLDRFFSVMVTGDDVKKGKPAPDTFAQAIEQSGATPPQSLVIEDSSAGIAAGLAAGAFVASVRTGERASHPRFLGAYDDLAALLPVITGHPA